MELFNSQKTLNIYKLNILNTAVFMLKVYNETAPATFFELCQKYLIRIQQGFQNCATRYLKQILINANTELCQLCQECQYGTTF